MDQFMNQNSQMLLVLQFTWYQVEVVTPFSSRLVPDFWAQDSKWAMGHITKSYKMFQFQRLNGTVLLRSVTLLLWQWYLLDVKNLGDHGKKMRTIALNHAKFVAILVHIFITLALWQQWYLFSVQYLCTSSVRMGHTVHMDINYYCKLFKRLFSCQQIVYMLQCGEFDKLVLRYSR